MKNKQFQIGVEGGAEEIIPVRVERQAGYGSVPGLDDNELAGPAELERQVTIDLWGPILALPVRRRRTGIRAVIDEFGHLDWGPFGTADFERLHGSFDKAMYKADKLKDQLRWTIIMHEMFMERIPGRAKYMVLKHLHMGTIELDHIESHDMYLAAQWALRALRLRREISQLRTASWRHRHADGYP